jgi:hypothetical protein
MGAIVRMHSCHAHFCGRILRGMTTTSSAPSSADWLAYQQWLDGIVSLPEAAELRGVHVDTLKKEAQAGKLKLLQRSEARWGVRRRDALMMK